MVSFVFSCSITSTIIQVALVSKHASKFLIIIEDMLLVKSI